ncbi:S-adenosyl-L-methionine-dependent methyltransferase [Cercophora newfieldiana]|uniref:S-adenosyl-L-methionine-dependent methyltransferase n=1 Tax=Cercophora newfieldiana TaxID=92897 RepID=A0AA39YLT3_9PEZI|nr:S-adenosyl-L-methionine-dependent methyltransferase [Cercophora newfieldiana]
MDIGNLIAESDSDRDSAYDAGEELEFMTVQSAVMRYRQENGRTYHAYKDGLYLLPNDRSENERLEFQHYIFLLTFNDELQIAPLPEKMHRVLDAGCGTGDWAIDFADSHPECHVTGVDLSPIQPVFNPPNVTFIVDDLDDTWTFGPPFDFIFSRFMTGSITDWPAFFTKAYDSLTPGGTIEVQDTIWHLRTDDSTIPPSSPLLKWTNLLREGMAVNGRPIDSAIHYKSQLAAAGFVDIEQHIYKWPTNGWAKDRRHKYIGKWNNENVSGGLAAFSLALFTRSKEEMGLGWKIEDVEALLDAARRDLRDGGLHAYFPVYVVYARKPS